MNGRKQPFLQRLGQVTLIIVLLPLVLPLALFGSLIMFSTERSCTSLSGHCGCPKGKTFCLYIPIVRFGTSIWPNRFYRCWSGVLSF